MIPLLRPTVDEQMKREMSEVLESGWWGQGPKVAELEKAFAEKVGAKYAVALSSATAALDLAIKVHDLDYSSSAQNEPGKYELVTTPMTFTSCAIVGEWNGLKVRFSDIENDSLCLDPNVLEIKPETKVVIVVNSHGRLADIPAIRSKFNGLIIEDCAHAFHTPGAGSRGDIAVWSFQAVKTCPAGDGGMITTNSEEIARKIRNLTWLGIEKSTYSRVSASKYTWDYDIVHGGTKSYMNDLNAVLVLNGMRRLEEVLNRRREIQRLYNEAFAGLPGVELPMYSETVQYYTIKVDNRDKVYQYLADKGISTSVHFKPLSEMTYWKKAVKQPLPVTDREWLKLLSLPVHHALTDEQVSFIIRSFKEALNV